MKIKALKKIVVNATTLRPGDGKVIEVPDAVAKNLIDQQRAEKVTETKTPEPKK
jgi:hypothetical protein